MAIIDQRRIVGNTLWLFADRVVRMAVGLFLGIWIARYLGPQQFGLFNYVTAFVSIFAVVVTLGLDGILVRDLVTDRDSRHVILGTAFTLQLIAGLVTLVLVYLAASFLHAQEGETQGLIAIFSLTLLFRCSDTIKFWLESQVRSKYTVLIENAVFLTMAGARVALLLGEAPLVSFIWIAVLESALTAIGLLLVYSRKFGRIRNWRVSVKQAVCLMRESWPLILAGLSTIVYMRIDQVMLAKMLNEEAVGIYSAAVRISEMWYFVPMIITASVFPSIVESNNAGDTKACQLKLQKLYSLMVYLGLAVAVVATLLAPWGIPLLYGEAYSNAAPVLAIHAWGGVFVGLGVASGRWFLVESLTNFLLARTLVAAILNILLNLALIPAFGPIGAAWATLASYLLSGLVFDFTNVEARRSVSMKLRALSLGMWNGN